MDEIRYCRVSLTTDCNRKCLYCFNEGQSRYPIKTLSDKDGFAWLVKQLVSNYGTQLVRFTGGEPLQHPEPMKMIQIAKSSGVKKVGLTTNGIYFNDYVSQFQDHGLDSCAVHLWQLDEKQKVNVSNLKDQMSYFKSQFARTRFNVVLLRSNFLYVKELIEHIAGIDIKLQILDLLQTNTADNYFEDEYVELDSLCRTLINCNFIETKKNKNVRFFYRDKTIIKLVDHYKNHWRRKSYCTRQLAYNPILITPDFQLSYCTHFNSPSPSIAEAVANRNPVILQDVINKMKSEAFNCCACKERIVLSDV